MHLDGTEWFLILGWLANALLQAGVDDEAVDRFAARFGRAGALIRGLWKISNWAAVNFGHATNATETKGDNGT